MNSIVPSGRAYGRFFSLRSQILMLCFMTLVLLSACAPSAPESLPEAVSNETENESSEMADGASENSELSYLERAMAGEFSGTTVTMTGVVVEEDDDPIYQRLMAQFEEDTGIDFVYEGTIEFETEIIDRVANNNPPDIANFPQPGLLAVLAKQGAVVDLSAHIDRGHLERQYIESWLDMTTMEGPDGEILAGVWHRVFGKSQVWYPKKAWDEAGYIEPQTWDELFVLMDTMVANGHTPWCINIESGAATGWIITDWMEDIMLRTYPLETYDAWVRGDLPFSSDEVKDVVNIMSEIWLNEAYVYGDRESIVNTFFADSADFMFEEPPLCWMYKQGNFTTSSFPEGSEGLVDYDFFYFPSINPLYGLPYLVGGDIYAAFDDRPEVLATMEYFTYGESVKVWLDDGGVLSPHSDTETFWYSDPIEGKVSGIIASSTAVRFDGSDLMPGEVGAGTFWSGMTAYISGEKDLDTVLKEIDESWPRDDAESGN